MFIFNFERKLDLTTLLTKYCHDLCEFYKKNSIK